MNEQTKKNASKKRRGIRVRAKIHGTAAKPRLSVFRSNKHVSAQLINDVACKTMAAVADKQVGDVKPSKERTVKVAVAFAVGEQLAEKAAKLGVKTVVFDKGPYRYHGIVAAVAEGARSKGLTF